MTYRIQGILKLPDGAPAANCEVEFVSRKNFSPLVQGAKTNILTNATGAYDVTLELGEYAVIVYTGGAYPAQAGTITLSVGTTPGLDLPSLLNRGDWVPATPEYMQQIAAWLVSAGEYAASAEASAQSAAESAASITGAISAHEAKDGAHSMAGVSGLQQELDSKLTKSGNLAGLTDKAAARGNLGITDVGSSIATAQDSAAVRASIAAMTPGDYGVGKMSAALPAYCAGSFDALRDNGFFRVRGDEPGIPAAGALGSIVLSAGWDDNAGTQILFPYVGPAQIRSRTGSHAWTTWRVIHDASSDKIEEGAFTPIILVTETGSMNTAGNVGRYRRSGGFVTCVGTVNISDAYPYAKSLKIAGLPFVGSMEGNLFCPAKIIVYGCEIAGRCVVGSKDTRQQQINIQLLPTTGRVRDILASDLSGHSNAKIAFEVTYAL